MDSSSASSNPFDYTPPSCPVDSKIPIAYPSVTFSFMFIAIVSASFASVIALRYNSVTVLHRRIRTPNISNVLWIIYFAVVFARTTVSAVRFGVNPANAEYYDIVSLVLNGVGSFFLALSLNHQRRWRSPDSPQTVQQVFFAEKGHKDHPINVEPKPRAMTDIEKERESLMNNQSAASQKKSWIQKYIGISEVFIAFAFLVFMAGIAVRQVYLDTSHEIIGYYVLIGTWSIAEIPAAVLVIIIVWPSSIYSVDGPTPRSKVCLFVAELLNFTNDLPLPIWAEILYTADQANRCIFYIASWLDLVHILFIASLVGFFIFVRNEYERNKGETIFTTLAQMRDSLAYRGF